MSRKGRVARVGGGQGAPAQLATMPRKKAPAQAQAPASAPAPAQASAPPLAPAQAQARAQAPAQAPVHAGTRKRRRAPAPRTAAASMPAAGTARARAMVSAAATARAAPAAAAAPLPMAATAGGGGNRCGGVCADAGGPLPTPLVSKQVACDMCHSARASIFCVADNARLCGRCDEQVHAVNELAARHVRSWLCDVCSDGPAAMCLPAERMTCCNACEVHIAAMPTRIARAPLPNGGFVPSKPFVPPGGAQEAQGAPQGQQPPPRASQAGVPQALHQTRRGEDERRQVGQRSDELRQVEVQRPMLEGKSAGPRAARGMDSRERAQTRDRDDARNRSLSRRLRAR